MIVCRTLSSPLIFFFNDTATTEIYTLSLHDALPISFVHHLYVVLPRDARQLALGLQLRKLRFVVGDGLRPGSIADADRKSTRLNSSHTVISYAVFCLDKKKTTLSTIGLSRTCRLAAS